jgi:hypothetical protein
MQHDPPVECGNRLGIKRAGHGTIQDIGQCVQTGSEVVRKFSAVCVTNSIHQPREGTNGSCRH